MIKISNKRFKEQEPNAWEAFNQLDKRGEEWPDEFSPAFCLEEFGLLQTVQFLSFIRKEDQEEAVLRLMYFYVAVLELWRTDEEVNSIIPWDAKMAATISGLSILKAVTSLLLLLHLPTGHDSYAAKVTQELFLKFVCSEEIPTVFAQTAQTSPETLTTTRYSEN